MPRYFSVRGEQDQLHEIPSKERAFWLAGNRKKDRRVSGRAVAGRPGMRSRTRILISVLKPERAAGAAVFSRWKKKDAVRGWRPFSLYRSAMLASGSHAQRLSGEIIPSPPRARTAALPTEIQRRPDRGLPLTTGARESVPGRDRS